MNDMNSNLFVYDGAEPGSIADRSDLCIGDKIISIDGVILLDLDDLNKVFDNKVSSRTLEVIRRNKVLTIEIRNSISQKENMN